MKIDKTVMLSCLVALVVFKVIDKLFLEKALEKIGVGNFDAENIEDSDLN
jgi:hypothetical protein